VAGRPSVLYRHRAGADREVATMAEPRQRLASRVPRESRAPHRGTAFFARSQGGGVMTWRLDDYMPPSRFGGAASVCAKSLEASSPDAKHCPSESPAIGGGLLRGSTRPRGASGAVPEETSHHQARLAVRPI
jgi:hypothetical protein